MIASHPPAEVNPNLSYCDAATMALVIRCPSGAFSSLDLGRASEVRPLFLTLAASALISQQLRASAQEGDTLKHPKTARQYHRGEQGNKKPLVRQLKSRAVTPVTGEAAGTTTLLRDCGKASTILSR